MAGSTVIFGCGAVGRAVAEALSARGERFRVAQRTAPAALPAGGAFAPCDLLDAAAARRAVDGADRAVLAIGLPYDARVWRRVWPAAMRNAVAACAAAGARLVFVDNLYQLGPQDAPRREDMPLAPRAGEKAAVLCEVARIWQAAEGRARVAALRCPDFYGPGVANSHLGALAFGRLARGKPARLVAPPDMPHDFAYVPDVARAALALLDAGDDAYGRAWNMPCAPTLTPRAILALGAEAVGVRATVSAVPFRLVPALGLLSRFFREVADVGYTFDRPYSVDGAAFARAFGFAPTPYAEGAAATMRAFRDAGRTVPRAVEAASTLP